MLNMIKLFCIYFYSCFNILKLQYSTIIHIISMKFRCYESGPNFTTHLKLTTIIEWGMVRCWSKHRHYKGMCLNEIGLYVRNVLTALGLIGNIIGQTYMIILWEHKSSIWKWIRYAYELQADNYRQGVSLLIMIYQHKIWYVFYDNYVLFNIIMSRRISKRHVCADRLNSLPQPFSS
jgi:hypothetical protein